MSRRQRIEGKSDRHAPAPNRDLWARRPCAGMPHSTYNKRVCRKRERQMGKRIVREEMNE